MYINYIFLTNYLVPKYPYVCANGPDSCEYRVKQIYEIAGVPMEANGPSCDTVEECNDPTFGELA